MAHARETLRRVCGPDADGYHHETYRLRYDFGVDAWAAAVDPSIRLVPLDARECVALLRGPERMLSRLRRRVERAIAGGSAFFRLSSRSGKDVPDGIRATSFDDVVRACRASERLREDLALHVSDATDADRLYVAIRPWLQIQAETRCFVVDRRLLCASTCSPDPQAVDVSSYAETCAALVAKLPYDDCAIDVASVAGDTGVVVIEVNPLWAFTDLYAFA